MDKTCRYGRQAVGSTPTIRAFYNLNKAFEYDKVRCLRKRSEALCPAPVQGKSINKAGKWTIYSNVLLTL